MADTRKSPSFFDWPEKVAFWFTRLYFLRFPLLTALAMVGLPYLGLRTSLKTLLASLYVSNWWGILLVSAVAFTTAWAILVTWRLIALYGDERFSRETEVAEFSGEPQRQIPGFSIKLWQAAVAAITALPVTIAVVYETVHEDQKAVIPGVGWGQALLAAALGLLVSLVLFFLAVVIQLVVNPEGRALELAREIFIVRWLPTPAIDLITRSDPAQTPRRSLRWLLRHILGKGFIDESAPSSGGGRFLAGHGLAASLLIVSLAVFIIAGQIAGRLTRVQMPALFFVVLLLMLLCWGLSGLSFLLDRYRVPVLILILLFSYFFSPNYFYQVPGDGSLTPLLPEDVIAGGTRSQRMIVVATEGGGIQAAAWTAQVLTGLQGRFAEFGRAVRVISSVSGGSVGALFFVNGYNPATGVPDPDALKGIVEMAEGNSLDDVARGLVYHDFIHSVFPIWEVGDDRGAALEKSWAKNCRQVCDRFTKENPGRSCPINCVMNGTLGGWAAEVRTGNRPANIFNATVVEDGDRLLVSNTDVEKPIDVRGRTNIARLLGGKDVQAVTAARLSASFPYVSPAARSGLDAPPSAKGHVVDGGYYDNYGTTSLVEWLDYALTKQLLDQVLVIQIQSFDDDPTSEKAAQARSGKVSEPTAAETNTGYVSQLLAPILTLLHIRTSAQASHKEIELDLLGSKWPDKVSSALFKYRCGDAPLTWKLTECQKSCISKCWEWQYATGNSPDVEMVGQFLNGAAMTENRAAEKVPQRPDLQKCNCD